METLEQKTERNCRVQARYDELMREGKHGHYETMFRVVREEVERERERCAQLCEQWNATPGSRLAREIRGEKPATHVKTAAEMRYDAAHDTSCVGAFARARPGKA